MDHTDIALLSLGVGIAVAVLSVLASMAVTTAMRIAKRVQTAGKDLCAVCGRPIARNAIYCRDHRHLAALRKRRPMDEPCRSSPTLSTIVDRRQTHSEAVNRFSAT